MDFERYNLKGAENKVNTIAIVVEVSESSDSYYGVVYEITNILGSYMKLEDAKREADELNKKNTEVNIRYDSYCIEMKTKLECDHPYWAVSTRCMGEINHCSKCGRDL